jgi:hypothetical protein
LALKVTEHEAFVLLEAIIEFVDYTVVEQVRGSVRVWCSVSLMTSCASAASRHDLSADFLSLESQQNAKGARERVQPELQCAWRLPCS